MLSNTAFQITLTELKNEYKLTKRVLKEHYKGVVVDPDYILFPHDDGVTMQVWYQITASGPRIPYNIAL